MTSTNHFRHRHLAGSQRRQNRLPEPYIGTPPTPPPPTNVHVLTAWDFTDGVHQSTSNPNVDSDLIRLDDDNWQLPVVDSQGNTVTIVLQWDGSTVSLVEIFAQWLIGGGETLARANGFTNPVTAPETQGPITWTVDPSGATITGDITITFVDPWNPA